MSTDTCGSTDTTTGEPCSNGPNCPYHAGPGRPTQYRPRYCEKAVELGRQGYTAIEIAAELGVTRQTLYNWRDKYDAFLDAMTRARDLAEAWWASQGREGVWSREFNASAYRLQMMNRFGWGEKSEHEHSGPEGGPIEVDVDDARQRLTEQVEQLARRETVTANGDGD